MILDEAMKHLLLGRCVGRYTVPGMKLKLVSKDEVPGLRDEDLDKLKGYNLTEEEKRNIKGTAIVDLNYVSEDGLRTITSDSDGNSDILLDYVRTWQITYSEMNAEDYYVYSETENLTTEQVYVEVMNGNKVYNDTLWPGGFYLAKYRDEDGEDGPALFYPDGELTGQIVVSDMGIPWWQPMTDEEFENRYYIKKE